MKVKFFLKFKCTKFLWTGSKITVRYLVQGLMLFVLQVIGYNRVLKRHPLRQCNLMAS